MITMKQVLVPTDFSEPADTALAYGRELAARFGATLHVLHVAENIYVTTLGAETYVNVAPDLQHDLEESARRRLDDLILDSDGSGPRTKAVVMTSAPPAFAIVDYAKDHDIDVIVMGTHGRTGFSHLMMGSVAERVVRLASCPVLTVRHPEREFVNPDTLVPVTRAEARA